jgi:hypothetical protein
LSDRDGTLREQGVQVTRVPSDNLHPMVERLGRFLMSGHVDAMPFGGNKNAADGGINGIIYSKSEMVDNGGPISTLLPIFRILR